MQLQCEIKEKEAWPLCVGMKPCLSESIFQCFPRFLSQPPLGCTRQGSGTVLPLETVFQAGTGVCTKEEGKEQAVQVSCWEFPSAPCLLVSALQWDTGLTAGTNAKKKPASRTSCQSWLLVSGISVGHVTAEGASPLCPKGRRGCNRSIYSVWRQEFNDMSRGITLNWYCRR